MRAQSNKRASISLFVVRLRVLGGAFNAAAQEMAGVLFRNRQDLAVLREMAADRALWSQLVHQIATKMPI